MKKFFVAFFTTLGVIFFFLILAGIYFYITDPLNLKPLLFGVETESGVELETEASDVTVLEDKHPLINESQEKALETVGIDPAGLPTEVTAEQEACFIEILGETRVNEIKAGATPSAVEVFRAKDCI